MDAVAVCSPHKTHFPIFRDTANDAEKTIEKRLKLMAPEPAQAIRRMQPYKRSAANPTLDPNEDPLWILFKLDVIDKHRVVLAANQLVYLQRLTVTSPDQEPEVFEAAEPNWQPFEEGAKLFTVILGFDQMLKPGVNFNADVALQVQFAETGLWCDGKPVVALFDRLIDYIERIVKRLGPFVG